MKAPILLAHSITRPASSAGNFSTAVREAEWKSRPDDPAAEHAIIAAFRGGASVAEIARRPGRPQGAVAWVLKKEGLKPNDRRRPRANERGDATRDDAARCCRSQDIAFQRAMRRAIAAGKEDPPMIGVFTDSRPLNAPKLFEPVPHGSSCTSPASECADLCQARD